MDEKMTARTHGSMEGISTPIPTFEGAVNMRVPNAKNTRFVFS